SRSTIITRMPAMTMPMIMTTASSTRVKPRGPDRQGAGDRVRPTTFIKFTWLLLGMQKLQHRHRFTFSFYHMSSEFPVDFPKDSPHCRGVFEPVHGSQFAPR